MPAKKNDDVPAVPLPPAEVNPPAGVNPPAEAAPAVTPPVEPAPAAPAPSAAPEVPPAAPAAPPASPAATDRPNPYAPSAAGHAQPGYGQPGYAQPGYAPAYAAPTGPQGLSITAMVCGIGGLLLAFVGLGFLPSLAAVIFGHLGQRRERAAKPFWLTGLITGYVGLGIALITFLAVLVFFLISIGIFGAAATYGSY